MENNIRSTVLMYRAGHRFRRLLLNYAKVEANVDIRTWFKTLIMTNQSLKQSLLSVFSLHPVRRETRVKQAALVSPSTGPDVEGMRDDFYAVGNDLRLALRQYEHRG